MQPLLSRCDYDLPVDVRHVAETAEVLRIREIEVFEHAHRWWCGRDADGKLLDRSFGDYLVRQTVPAWVRHYCRSVLSLSAVNQLDPRKFGVDRPTMNRMTRAEQLYAVVVAVVGWLVYLAVFS